jgi:signal peptide peptidase SppA
MTYLPRLARLVFNQVHCITADGAEAVLAALDGRIGEIAADSFTGTPVTTERGQVKYRLDGSVAVIPVHGELVTRGAWVGARSGLVSYEGLRHALGEAAGDKRVKSIVLDIDSPGGMAAGMTETAALIREIGATKPVTAVANPLAASAAYGLASAANRIVAGPDSALGSIGVVYIHADHSGELEKKGVRVTLVHAGAHKVDGNPFGPLSPQVKADIQGRIDAVHQNFVAIVLAGRPRLTEAAVRETEARVYRADEAVARGLADTTGTLTEAVASAGGVTTRPKPRASDGRRGEGSPQQKEAAKMLINDGVSAAESAGGWEALTVAQLNEAVATLRATISGDAAPTTVTPAATAPRETTAAAPVAPPAPAAAPAETATAAHARGRSEERARIAAILGSDAAKTRPVQARVIALESELAPDKAAGMLAQMPEESSRDKGADFYRAVAASGGTPKVPHSANADEAPTRSLAAGMGRMVANMNLKKGA